MRVERQAQQAERDGHQDSYHVFRGAANRVDAISCQNSFPKANGDYPARSGHLPGTVARVEIRAATDSGENSSASTGNNP